LLSNPGLKARVSLACAYSGIALITLAGLIEFLYAPIRRALWRDACRAALY